LIRYVVFDGLNRHYAVEITAGGRMFNRIKQLIANDDIEEILSSIRVHKKTIKNDWYSWNRMMFGIYDRDGREVNTFDNEEKNTIHNELYSYVARMLSETFSNMSEEEKEEYLELSPLETWEYHLVHNTDMIKKVMELCYSFDMLEGGG
jgi:hypothetical protein